MSLPPNQLDQSNSSTSSSSDPKFSATSISSSARPRQSAWGLPSQQPGSRRGLASLNTSINSGLAAASSASSASLVGGGVESRRSILTSPPVGTAPAFAWGSSSITSGTSSPVSGLNSIGAGGSGVGGGLVNIRSGGSARHTPSQSSSTPLSGGQQQLGGLSSQLLSPRSRANTPFSNQTSASSAAPGPATTSQQGGGIGGSGTGSGGGPSASQQQQSTITTSVPASRSGTFSPTGSSTHGLSSPTNSGFDRGGFGGSTPSGSGGSSLAKITVTQVFLLLSSITDKEGKGKWESQAESIRKLVAEHGMEVFTKYFRRLVTGNAAQIFSGQSSRDSANYPLLVEEVEKVAKEPEQARKIAETIDTSDGDLFRDFDLSTFVTHFKLDPISSTLILAAFSHSQKADLRKKASTLLSSLFANFLQFLADPTASEKEFPDSVIATAAFEVLRSNFSSQRDGSEKPKVYYALEQRYTNQDQSVPDIVRSAMTLVEFLDGQSLELANHFIDRGCTSTESMAATEESLRSFKQTEIDEKQIAGALIAIVLSPTSPRLWKPQNFVNAVENQYGSRISWAKVIESFDRESIWISPDQFLKLYGAMVPLARRKADLDIQNMWGGEWKNPATQLSFAIAFAALRSDQLDAQSIPNLRPCYDVDECFEGLDGFDEKIKDAKHDPMISLDAATAIMRVVWTAQNFADIQAHSIHSARAVIQEKITLFLCSCGSLPQPWSPQHVAFMDKFVTNCLMKNQPDFPFILHCLWKQNKSWMAQKLYDFHANDPMKLPLILEHAQEHGWLAELCTSFTGFGIDLAALAHRKGLIDLQEWIDEKISRGMTDLGNSIAKFLEIKAQDEMRTAHAEQMGSRTVILAMKTVSQMLLLLEDEPLKILPSSLRILQRTCVRAYPRLINYGGEWDDLIEANGANSNQLSPGADAAMQEYYKRMYNQELAVRDIIQVLSSSKESTDPQQQDLFACMIHGLFDEFVCFHEYPLSPLATTAVLFGGIISYRLISGIALKIGLGMVLEAVRDYEPESSMYKFGLQAILHFLNRLPEWPEFCQELVQIPGLQGTEAYSRAQDALREGRSENGEANGTVDHDGAHMNGEGPEEVDSLVQHFRSISSDVALHNDLHQSPDEDVQGKVLFVLNNVTEENLSTKMGDLLEVLERRYHRWFAEYLVDQRAKFQANYQPLYLKILELINNKGLWADVLRETYLSVQKVMNAEATLQNAADRTHLKNLGTWLGSLTLARDKPIKHKNIAFRDLLIEGFETARLLLVIPFTCEVLSQGARSRVFKPPNPWVMEIIGILMELYDMEQTKIQQKFAIELLLSNFGLPRTGEGIERASEIKKRQMEKDMELKHMIQDGLQDFHDIGDKPMTRFSPQMQMVDLGNMLVYPQLSTNNPAQQERVRHVVQTSIQQAIQDIAQLVVERSVTVAEIATKELVQKDFSLEGDEEKLRNSFVNMVRPLASSLANVTCKEPLKQSINNYMRQAAAEMPDDLPEGTILVTINDNIEIACEHVRSTAEERAIAEVDGILEEEINKRRDHKRNYPSEPFRDPIASQWSSYLPEPFKMVPGGLNQQQLEIYRNFGPQTRGIVNHTQQASTDSGRQVPDVLQDAAFPNVPNLSTPAEQPVLPHQPSATQSRATPAVSDVRAPSQVNGYLDYPTVMNHIQAAFGDITEITKQMPNKRWRDLNDEDTVIETCERIVSLIRSSENVDALAREIAPVLCQQIYEENLTRFELEVKTKLAYLICQLSNELMLSVQGKFHRVIETMALDTSKVTLVSALLESGFIDYSMVDNVIYGHMIPQSSNDTTFEAVAFFEELLKLQLLSSLPIALRSDLNKSFGILGRLAAEDHPQAKSLVEKLRLPNPNAPPAPPSPDATLPDGLTSRQAQTRYVLDEWINLVASPNATDVSYVAFTEFMRRDSIFDGPESLVDLMRYGFDLATECDMQNAFNVADALAKLVVVLSRTQGTGEGPTARPEYTKQLLSFAVIILNHQQNVLKDGFNQRIFCRFFSTVIYEWQGIMLNLSNDENKQMLFALAETFMLLEPRVFPTFVHSWISLVSHRVFMPMLLKLPNNEGGEIFTDIMVGLFKFVCPMVQPKDRNIAVRELYRGALKLMLILHHDFAEFLVENHIRLCNVIPTYDNQLRNLVLSAQPSSYVEVPDPLTMGLRADRLDESKRTPTVAGDNMTQADKDAAKGLVDAVLSNDAAAKTNFDELKQKIESFAPASSADASEACLSYLHFIVLYVAQKVLKDNKQANGVVWDENSTQAHFFAELSQKLRPDARYFFLSALFNQLRYPNSHTHFFNYALFHIWYEEQKQADNKEVNGSSDEASDEESVSRTGPSVREQISRIVLERMMVHKPHPWGLLLMTMELLKNSKYAFWETPFIKAAPEAKQIFMVLYQNFEGGGQRILG